MKYPYLKYNIFKCNYVYKTIPKIYTICIMRDLYEIDI